MHPYFVMLRKFTKHIFDIVRNIDIYIFANATTTSNTNLVNECSVYRKFDVIVAYCLFLYERRNNVKDLSSFSMNYKFSSIYKTTRWHTMLSGHVNLSCLVMINVCI